MLNCEAWIPSPASRFETPIRSSISRVRACTTAAREVFAPASCRSTTVTSWPCPANEAATANPTGPAPTTSTSVRPGSSLITTSFTEQFSVGQHLLTLTLVDDLLVHRLAGYELVPLALGGRFLWRGRRSVTPAGAAASRVRRRAADCCDEELDMLRSLDDVPGRMHSTPCAGHELEPERRPAVWLGRGAGRAYHR